MLRLMISDQLLLDVEAAPGFDRGSIDKDWVSGPRLERPFAPFATRFFQCVRAKS